MTTLSSVRPFALWMVTAQASLRRSCRREHEAPDVDQVQRMGVIGHQAKWGLGRNQIVPTLQLFRFMVYLIGYALILVGRMWRFGDTW